MFKNIDYAVRRKDFSERSVAIGWNNGLIYNSAESYQMRACIGTFL